MKLEMEIMRPLVAEIEEPLRSVAEARRAIRQTTDAAIGDGLMANDVATWARLSARVMMSVAEVLVTFEREPALQHFVEAGAANIEYARNVMDRGLQVEDWDQAQRGAVMLEITCRGIYAALGLPYEDLFRAEVECRDISEVIAEYRSRVALAPEDVEFLDEAQRRSDAATETAAGESRDMVERFDVAPMVGQVVSVPSNPATAIRFTFNSPEPPTPPECGDATPR